MCKRLQIIQLIILFAICGISAVPSSLAQVPYSAETLNHHVIVILDRSGSIVNFDLTDQYYDILRNDLPRFAFRDTTLAGSGRRLLDKDKGDYLSIVSFGLRRDRPDFSNFIHTSEQGREYGLRYSRDFSGTVFNELVRDIDALSQGAEYFFRMHYSAISVAIPLSIKDLKVEGEPRANRTFILLVSDGEFNGGDPVAEIQSIVENADNNRNVGRVRNQQLALDAFYDLSELYIWQKKEQREVKSSRSYKVELSVYELFSSASLFAIESLMNFDNQQMYLERVRGGYQASYDLSQQPDTVLQLDVKKIEAILRDRSGAVVNQQIFSNIEEAQALKITPEEGLKHSARRRGDYSLELNFWVHMDDDVYGAHALNPAGEAIQGALGLRRVIPVEFEKTERIYGVLPIFPLLFDGTTTLPFINTQGGVKWFWQFLLAFIALGVFVYLLRKYATDPTPVLEEVRSLRE